MSNGNGTHDIAALIGETEDRGQRGILVVLHKISKTVADNSLQADDIGRRMDRNQEVFNTHLSKFETYAAGEKAMFERITGMWKVLAVIVPALLSLGAAGAFYILAKQISVNDSQGIAIAKLQAEVAELRANVSRNTSAIPK